MLTFADILDSLKVRAATCRLFRSTGGDAQVEFTCSNDGLESVIRILHVHAYDDRCGRGNCKRVHGAIKGERETQFHRYSVCSQILGKTGNVLVYKYVKQPHDACQWTRQMYFRMYFSHRIAGMWHAKFGNL
jgi:hypothetical protein